MAREHGVHPETMQYRISRGWPIELAVTKPPLAGCGKPKLLKDGRRAVDVARQNGVSTTTYRSRLDDGWPPEQAAFTPTQTKEDDADRIRQYASRPGQRPGNTPNRTNAAERWASGLKALGRRAPDSRPGFLSSAQRPPSSWTLGVTTPSGPAFAGFLETQAERDLRELI